MINFYIDGNPVVAKDGETILSVARREGYYIPTMCYLTKVAPITSCRMCVVEVEESDGFVLSCSTQPVEGIHVTTSSPELFSQRAKIVELYNVNHPLECGVCDKSGECELQNKTLEHKVAEQRFNAKDQKRDNQKWGLINYDPSLCIMCEKCVTTCNQAIGDDAIEVEYGGYSSTIIPKGSNTLDCTFCGECIAVCPVGAMTSSGFKYTTNSWELKSIPSVCTHCSAGCKLYYDVKQNEIKRVKNDFETMSLCGAGRFGYDFDNKSVSSKEQFEKAVEAFKEAETIKFNSIISNEEAKILQTLKEEFGYKLVNHDAYAYKKFLTNFSSTAQKSLYSADLADIENSDFIIILGTYIKSDNPAVRYAITKASKQKGADVVYMHSIEDIELKNTVKQFIKYEVGSEEGVVAMLADSFLDKTKLTKENLNWINGLDIGYISAESNIGEEEIVKVKKRLRRKKSPILIIGQDFYSHKRADNIAKIVGLFESSSNFKTMLIPSDTNTLGVATICELDNNCEGSVVGYNEDGDFVLTSSKIDKENTLFIPSLTQQEGTITNIDKRVVKLNSAIKYEGYSLNHIANSLGIKSSYTVEYTKCFPVENGYKAIEFDDMELDGYKLDYIQNGNLSKIDEIDEIDNFNGLVIYGCSDVLHFNKNTVNSSQLDYTPMLYASKQFISVAKVNDGDSIIIKLDNKEIRSTIKLNKKMKGTVAMLNHIEGVSTVIGSNNYRFIRASILKGDASE